MKNRFLEFKSGSTEHVRRKLDQIGGNDTKLEIRRSGKGIYSAVLIVETKDPKNPKVFFFSIKINEIQINIQLYHLPKYNSVNLIQNNKVH